MTDPDAPLWLTATSVSSWSVARTVTEVNRFVRQTVVAQLLDARSTSRPTESSRMPTSQAVNGARS